MQNHVMAEVQSNNAGPAPVSHGDTNAPKVVVCVDDSMATSKVIPRAKAVAGALGAELMLVHVIEPQEFRAAPLDPVEWDIRRKKARLHVAALAAEHATDEISISTKVLEGRFAEQICSCVAGRPQDITALCRRDGDAQWHVGGTLHRILESGPGSILLVPETVTETGVASFPRVFVPLDGSPRAESPVPVAIKIARAQGAELVLVHATPEPALTQIGPMEPEDIALRDQLQRRNERVAHEYLERLRARICSSGVNVSTLVLKGGDVRRMLANAVGTDPSALLVMSSHGVSGHGDVPSGDIAGFMLARCEATVLMIRRPRESDVPHIFSEAETKGVRRPAGTNA